MEYPIWHLTTFGGGFWIAFIATIHVFVAQFAVGGGLFLVLSEQMAYRTGSDELLDYVKKHSKFFLLLTMVFGGVSGVALWFSMALLSPQGALLLVREFLFAWATEWVWFVGEIVALLIYFYSWDKMSRSDHIKIGWFYFIFAWLSLFTINGVVGFMLTPGEWLQTHDFWDGIFNPTFWPQLAFRSFLSVMLAGLFGFVTAAWLKDPVIRCKMVRLCSIWTLLGLILLLPCGYWYMMALPPEQAEMILNKSHRVAYFLKMYQVTAPIILVGGLIMAICMPRKIKFPSALILLLIALVFYGSFEFIREAGRKPYVLWGVVYSNSVMVDKAAEMEGKSLLQEAKWVPDNLRKITDENKLKAGAWLYQMECVSCHAINGPMNDIVPRTVKYSAAGLDAFISGMGKLSKYMSPFLGDETERMALAEYIDSLSPQVKTVLAEVKETKVEPAPFVADQEYVLMAWSLEGLRLIVESEGRVSVSESGSKVRAQLLLRGDPPEVVTDDVKIICELKNVHQPYKMKAKDGFFESPPINVLPYSDDGYQPLPLVEVSAVDDAGEILATTTIVLPVSTRASCNNCHGGDWAVKGQGGLAAQTADDFLKIHDRDNYTDFTARVKLGDTIDCLSCHDGDTQLDLSTALHGFHAVYLSGKENEACTMCHSQESLRGLHRTVGMECVNCHGVMENHALALLKAEEDKLVAKDLIGLLMPVDMEMEEINPRMPWTQEPDCLTCHVDFAGPDTDSAFNVWNEDKSELFRNRKDEMDAVMCAACHNAPHAVFPAVDERDNLRALQYMGEAKPIGSGRTCTVCHENDMDYAAHHPGMGLE
ncbi:cytochrome ubiquinol oxidase subunit I [Maridesulfovibrio ferrireducens]|uniref:cytochrome ubiquinol oxidase subunit I n=1 Tax=Maridesulfovibrio ferrireducens TaxID=246191 RepID=UPI001A220A63|nr:cytochrome ubiquinol oxidase subunit I [Maridesulfovibrio ferrireducens]MBI9109832.1 cytochrome ubiquinol oxidase subunit I [Maridesulfovibrio ferrireducens]